MELANFTVVSNIVCTNEPKPHCTYADNSNTTFPPCWPDCGYLPAFYKCYIDNNSSSTKGMEKCCNTPVSTTSDGCYKWCVQDHRENNEKQLEEFADCLGAGGPILCTHGGLPPIKNDTTCPIPANKNSASATRMSKWSKVAMGLLALVLVGQASAGGSSTTVLSDCAHPGHRGLYNPVESSGNMSLNNTPTSERMWTYCNAHCAAQGLKPVTCEYDDDDILILTCSPEGGLRPNITSSASRARGWPKAAFVMIVLALMGQTLANDLFNAASGDSTAPMNALATDNLDCQIPNDGNTTVGMQLYCASTEVLSNSTVYELCKTYCGQSGLEVASCNVEHLNSTKATLTPKCCFYRKASSASALQSIIAVNTIVALVVMLSVGQGLAMII